MSYFRDRKYQGYKKHGDLVLRKIKHLIKIYPNDADLGEAVRKLYNK